MTRDEHNAAMALYADADRRATASLVEMVAATLLLKLNPPARGDDVVSVTFSPDDIEETLRTHTYVVTYEDDAMTLSLTPLTVAA